MTYYHSRSLASLPLVLLAFTYSALAQESPNRDSANPSIQRFVQNTMKANDKNRDGHVTKDEAINQLKNNFDRVDGNQDGKITTTELAVLAKRMQTRQRERNRSAERSAIPEGVIFEADIPYRTGNDKWKLDLARPKDESATPRAAIVFVHGGGWRSGDKGSGQWRSLPMDYAAQGYVCISINYRLTDEATVLDCIADCKCAVRWLRSHADEYNIDPKRIGAYGNSAGAHLVSILGLTSAQANLEGDGPFRDESSLVQAVCCSAPPADFKNWGKNRPENTQGPLSRLFGDTNVDAVKRQASPITHASDQAPPFLIIHGTADKTVPVTQGDALHRTLREAGAKDVTYMKIEGAGHGVFNQHNKRTEPAMREFFDRVLQPTDKRDEVDNTQ
ncbi:MAG: alpha/beta fold hydrolase [Rubripirellula sp.]